MTKVDWAAVDAANAQRHKAKLAQQWEEQVLSVPPARRVNVGKMDTWRYVFLRKNEIVSVPLYEHPETGAYVAILPDDGSPAGEWAVAFMTPLSEFVGRAL